MTAKDFLLHPDNSDKSVVEILDLYAKEKASLAFDAGMNYVQQEDIESPNKTEFLKLHFHNI